MTKFESFINMKDEFFNKSVEESRKQGVDLSSITIDLVVSRLKL